MATTPIHSRSPQLQQPKEGFFQKLQRKGQEISRYLGVSTTPVPQAKRPDSFQSGTPYAKAVPNMLAQKMRGTVGKGVGNSLDEKMLPWLENVSKNGLPT
jgi:hypothetical protein